VSLLAIALEVLYVAVAMVWPFVANKRRTGTWAFRATPGAGRFIGALFFCGSVLVLLGPVLDLAGTVGRTSQIDALVVQGFGVVLAVAALPLVVAAQRQMGASWRVGVDPEERTELVTAGLFRVVRNPIYSGMVLMAFGIALMVPNGVSFAAAVDFLVAVELQVRTIEEPYLRRVHGSSFESYVARSGRFLPAIGRSL
jgi:protein-S-isoprenylcysteine O-methyltransferase Ste14